MKLTFDLKEIMLSDVDDVSWMNSACILIIIFCLNDVKVCNNGIILMVNGLIFINDIDLANPR
jgi:hypothetical protein